MTIYLLEIAGYALLAFGAAITLDKFSTWRKHREQMRIAFPETKDEHHEHEEHHEALVG